MAIGGKLNNRKDSGEVKLEGYEQLARDGLKTNIDNMSVALTNARQRLNLLAQMNQPTDQHAKMLQSMDYEIAQLEVKSLEHQLQVLWRRWEREAFAKAGSVPTDRDEKAGKE